MSDINPYQSPVTPAQPIEPQADEDVRLLQAVEILGQTKPWVRFLSVLGLIMTVLVLGAVVAMSLYTSGQNALPFFLGMIGMVSLALILAYLIPSLLLWRYAANIASYQNHPTPASLAAAIGAQKVFWQYVGALGAIAVLFIVGATLMDALL